MLHYGDTRRQIHMACFYERGAHDHRLGLVRVVLLPDHNCEMFGDIGVEAGALGVPRTDGTGDFLLNYQNAAIDRQLGHDLLREARAQVGCKMGDRTEG